MGKLSESKFYEKSRDDATWWMNLNWPNSQPDVPQCFSKNCLINIVSIATGWKSRKSDPWLKKNKILASHGDYCFFVGVKNENALDTVKKLLMKCGDDNEAYLTVLPLSYYYDGYYYEFPIFRFSRFRNSRKFYIHDSKVYDCSIEKLVKRIEFPGQIIAYPREGRLVPKSETDPKVDMCFYKPDVGFFSGIGHWFNQYGFSKYYGKDVLSRPWDGLVLKTYTNKYSDSEYNTIAVENMTRYMHRGGHNQGDVSQFLEGVELYNTIGYSMGIMPSEEDLIAARNNNCCNYSGDALKLIKHIATKIEDNCGDDKQIWITVIPFEVFCDHKLIEMPLFRFKLYQIDQYKFVDSTGRVYKNFQDWRDNNKLPPGKQLFPLYGHLRERDSTGNVDYFEEGTPSIRAGAKILRGADMIIGLAGLGTTVVTLFTGGLVLPLISVGSAVYGTLRSAGTVIDRGLHDEPISPITDHEARMIWLGIAANLLSFGSMGATMGLTILAAKGHRFTATFCTIVNISNGSTIAVNSAALLNSTIHMLVNWEEMKPGDWAMQLMSIAFWAKGSFQFKTASTMIHETRSLMLDGFTRQLTGQQLKNFKDFRVSFSNDAFLIKFLQSNANAGRSPEIMVNYLSQLQGMAFGLEVPYKLGPDGTVFINNRQVPLDLILQLTPYQREVLTFEVGFINQEQLTKFHEIVGHHGHDYQTIFKNIVQIKDRYPNMNMDQVMEGYFKLWDYHKVNQQFSEGHAALTGGQPLPFRFHETNPGQIVIGNGHVFDLLEIRALDNAIVKMLMTDFNPMITDQVHSFNLIREKISNDELLPWINKNNNEIQNLTHRMAKLQHNSNLFQNIPVKLMDNGEMLLKDLIQLPFVRVERILADNNNFIKLLNVLPEDLSTKKLASLSKDIKNSFHEFRKTFRLKFEFHRQEAFNWFIEITKHCIDKESYFGKITKRSQLTYTQHQDRLVSIHSNAIREFKNMATQIVEFACRLNPYGVIDFASNFDLASTYYKNHRNAAESAIMKFKNDNINIKTYDIKKHFNLSENVVSVKDCINGLAKFKAFGNSAELFELRFNSFKSDVIDKYYMIAENMWSKIKLKLPNSIKEDDVAGITAFIKHPDNVVKFGSHKSAACHVYKKNLNEPSQYIRLANNLINDVESTLIVTDFGNSTLDFSFNRNGGKAVVMKFESRDIILVSFTPNLQNQS